MAITAEVEVLRQQLKGKGMYTVPPTTSDPKPSNNVHFQPIEFTATNKDTPIRNAK